MKRLSFILLLLCIPLMFVGFDNKLDIKQVDSVNFQDSIREGLNRPFTAFNIGQSITYSDKIYTLCCYDENDPVLSKRSKVFKHINNIQIISMEKTGDASAKIINRGEGYEINNLTLGIVPVGLYDKEYDIYVVGDKVIDFNNSDFANQQIELKLKNGDTLKSQINNDGYFIFAFKSINNDIPKSQKSIFTYGKEIEYIKIADKSRNSDIVNWK